MCMERISPRVSRTRLGSLGRPASVQVIIVVSGYFDSSPRVLQVRLGNRIAGMWQRLACVIAAASGVLGNNAKIKAFRATADLFHERRTSPFQHGRAADPPLGRARPGRA